jgi:nicotinamidase-related amidase
MKAILIIDMQKICFTLKTPRHDESGVIRRINLLAEKFRDNGDKVVFIQHDGTKNSYCIPHSEEWELLDEMKIEKNDKVIPKTVNDSFYRSALKRYLDSNQIKELVITGCATDFCVDATVKSALVQDYDITVIADAHTTADRFDFKASELIDYYNWIWSEMLPSRTRIKVINCEDYLKNKTDG